MARVTPSYRLKDLLETRDDVLWARVPLEIINVLTQVRKTIEEKDIFELAVSMLTGGQRTPGEVAVLDAKKARAYLKELNKIFDANHTLCSMRKVRIDGKVRYLFLISGHRRLRAAKEAQRLIDKGPAQSAVFDGRYRCGLLFGPNIHQALGAQLIENYHKPVPLAEEIDAVWRYWRYLNELNGGEKVKVKEFADRIGRTPEWVRRMLRFTSLPQEAQKMVSATRLQGASFSLLVEVQRLVEAYERYGRPLSEPEIVQTARYLVLKRVSASAFRKEVTARIEALRGDQAQLFELAAPDERAVRKVAAAGLIQELGTGLRYLDLVHRMIGEGAFGEVSPYLEGKNRQGDYSPISAARTAHKLALRLQDVLPHLITLMQRERRGTLRRQLEAVLARHGITLAVLETFLREQGEDLDFP